jgi:hypothetical protein
MTDDRQLSHDVDAAREDLRQAARDRGHRLWLVGAGQAAADPRKPPKLLMGQSHPARPETATFVRLQLGDDATPTDLSPRDALALAAALDRAAEYATFDLNDT